jgi:hypothetical protein
MPSDEKSSHGALEELKRQFKKQLDEEREKRKQIERTAVLILIAAIFEGAVILTFRPTGDGIGRTPLNTIIEFQDEAIRTLRIETNRLKSELPATPCSGRITTVLDQLRAQFEERIKDYTRSKPKGLMFGPADNSRVDQDQPRFYPQSNRR